MLESFDYIWGWAKKFGIAKILFLRRYLNDNWHQITDFCIEVIALFATHAIYSNVPGILNGIMMNKFFEQD